MSPAPTKSVRLKRIETAILHEITQFMQTELDNRDFRSVQLTRVEVSRDLSHAKIYFLLPNTEKNLSSTQAALNKITSLLHHHLARKLNFRITPQIKFYYDEQAKKTNDLLSLLETI